MKKNKFFWIIAAVVIAALAMTGCPPDDGDDPDPIEPPVTEVELEGIEFEPASVTIGVGQTMTSPLEPLPVPRTATLGVIEWSSEDTEYVTVTDEGIIHAVAITESPVKVYAKSGTITGYCEVTVAEHGAPTTSISVEPDSYSLIVGGTHTLVAVQVPFGAANPIEWTSEDEDKVTVDEHGVITAVAATSTPVKVIAALVSDSTISGFSSITVTAAPTLTSITVSPSTLSLEVSQTHTLTAAKVPAEAADTIKWSSEDETKVTVNEDTGLITAVAVTTSAVKIFAKSVESPTISGFSLITVAEVVIPPEPPEGPIELKLKFIPGPGSTVTPPTLPTPENNIYKITDVFDAGNFQGGTAGTGLIDTVLVYPDRVLNGDFKFRARVQITGTTTVGNGASSASKGLIIGAFKGKDAVDDFQTGSGGTVATAINIRLNNVIRNLQSRTTDRLAAVGVNATIHDKLEEFIYEVIRTEDGITTNMYISKNGQKLTLYSSTNPIGWTGGSGETLGPADIQADTPVYAGIALCAITANISQIELWDGDLEGDPVFYSGDSTPAKVDVRGMKVTVKGDKGSLTDGAGYGSDANPALYYVKESDADGSLELETIITPAYADEDGVTYYLSTNPAHHSQNSEGQIAVDEDTGVVTITGQGSATIEAISEDTLAPSYFLSIIVTGEYSPVEPFAIHEVGNPIPLTTRTILQDLETITLETSIPAAILETAIVRWTSTSELEFVDADTDGSYTGPVAKVRGTAAAASGATVTATATTTPAVGEPDVENTTVPIVVLARGEGTDKVWDFSDAAFRTAAEAAGFTWGASSDGSGTVDGLFGNNVRYNSRTAKNTEDGLSWTIRLVHNGAGSKTARRTTFEVTGNCKVTVYANANGENRPVRFATDSANQTGVQEFMAFPEPGGNSNSETARCEFYYYGGDATTVYIYSGSNGINFYQIGVEY
jgi:uncharacterized protein YjdB